MFNFVTWLISNQSRAAFLSKHCNLRFYRDENKSGEESFESLLIGIRVDSRCELTKSHTPWVAKCLSGYRNHLIKTDNEEEVFYVERMIDELMNEDENCDYGFHSDGEDEEKPEKVGHAKSSDSMGTFCSAVTIDSLLEADKPKDSTKSPSSKNQSGGGLDPYVKMLQKMANNKSKDGKGEPDDEYDYSSSSSECYSGHFDSSVADESKYDHNRSVSKDFNEPKHVRQLTFKTSSPRNLITYSSDDGEEEEEKEKERFQRGARAHRKTKSFHGITSLTRRQGGLASFSQEEEEEGGPDAFKNASYAVQASQSNENSGLFLRNRTKHTQGHIFDDAEMDVHNRKHLTTGQNKSVLSAVSKDALLPKVGSVANNVILASRSFDKKGGGGGQQQQQDLSDESSAVSYSKIHKEEDSCDDNSTIATSLASASESNDFNTKKKTTTFKFDNKENSSAANMLLLQPSQMQQMKKTTQVLSPVEKQQQAKAFRAEIEQTIVAKDVSLFNLRLQLDAKNKYFSAAVKSGDNTRKYIEETLQSALSTTSATELLLTDSADYVNFEIPRHVAEKLTGMEKLLIELDSSMQHDNSPSLRKKVEYLRACISTLRQRISTQKELTKMAAYYKRVLQEKNKGLKDLTTHCKTMAEGIISTSKATNEVGIALPATN